MQERLGGLDEIKVEYKAANCGSFALFLGAGVNLFPSDGGDIKKKYFETYSWKELLKALYLRNKDNSEKEDLFDSLLNKHGQDWPRLASELTKGLDVETLVSQIDSIIYGKIPRKDRYGRLSRRLLNQAPTLHGAVCFSTKIKCRTKTSWTFERNPRIGTIITSNYDFFFGAGWTSYQGFKKHWKVQTPFGKKEPKSKQRPINYIHGYLPYKQGEKKNIVFTKESYDEFYAPGGFSINALRETIRGYNIIFLGVSFIDLPLCEMLESYKGERCHFIIDKAGSDAIERAKLLGVHPVAVPKYSDIALALEEIYTSALSQKECEELGFADQQAYWDRLEKGPEKIRSKSIFGIGQFFRKI